MAPRKPKNIVDDIASFTSSWLGGAPKGEAVALTKGKGAVKEILGGLDSGLTGGVGRAALKDAQAGPNAVPVNLLKVGAQNVAAAAVGYGAAKVVGKVAKNLPEIGVHFSATSNLKKITFDPKRINTGGAGVEVSGVGQTFKFSGRDIAGNKIPAKDLAKSAEHMKWIMLQDTTGSAYVTRSPRGIRDPEIDSYIDRDLYIQSARATPKQKVLKEIKIRAVDPLENDIFPSSRLLNYQQDVKKLEQAIKKARRNPFYR